MLHTAILFVMICAVSIKQIVSTVCTPEGTRLLRTQCRLRSDTDIDESLKKSAGIGIQLLELIPEFTCQIDCSASLVGKCTTFYYQ
jgi:hypothetical protein